MLAAMVAHDTLFTLRVNEVEATVRHHLDVLAADLRRSYGITSDGMAVLICDALEGYLADPAPGTTGNESLPGDR